MPLVDIYLSGRKYTVSCEAGHESRLRELADYVGARLRELSESGVTGSDAHMLVLASLLIADQLFDANEAAERSRGSAASSPASPAHRDASPKDTAARDAAIRDAASREAERAAAVVIDAAARRIEELAARLERA
jgi:cell division protein ZapA